jgi:collagenase-like PrtC family protease
MQFSLGALQYFWPRRQTLDFYRSLLDWAGDGSLQAVYLGETVCSKRRELRFDDWIALADDFAAAGIEPVLSTLALLEAESELGYLQRQVGNGRYAIEANDMAAVQLCRETGVPFVGGPLLNVYNLATVQMLIADGMYRLAIGVELGRAWLEELIDAADAAEFPLPPLEVIGYGRLPLAHSARCFTARAYDVGKDDCAFRCLNHPAGMPLRTRVGEEFLQINGIQIQTAEACDLVASAAQMRGLGVSMVRLYPEQSDLRCVLARWRQALAGELLPTLGGHSQGYWEGDRARPRPVEIDT